MEGLEIDVAADVHVGTSPEMVVAAGVAWGMGTEVHVDVATMAEGTSVKMVMSAGLAVGWMERKTTLCAAFNVDVAGQDVNTM